MNFTDLKPLFDYSAFEVAIQAFFADGTQGGGLFVTPPDEHDDTRENWVPADGKTAFFTAFQATVFQKARPRVSLEPISYKQLNLLVLDSDGRPQKRAFAVPLEFVVVTKTDYAFHTDALATVRAIVARMNPIRDAIQTSGLNAFLTTFELSQIWDAGNNLATGITGDNAAYVTSIKYAANFAIRASAWPAGTLTT